MKSLVFSFTILILLSLIFFKSDKLLFKKCICRNNYIEITRITVEFLHLKPTVNFWHLLITFWEPVIFLNSSVPLKKSYKEDATVVLIFTMEITPISWEEVMCLRLFRHRDIRSQNLYSYLGSYVISLLWTDNTCDWH